MEPSCVRQTAIPGTSQLYGDFLYHFERVTQFYPAYFADLNGLADRARSLSFPDNRRSTIVAALRKQNESCPALDRLAAPGTVAVVTGQQVGLLSGPAYTIYKALTAAKLADELCRQGVNAVPVFWLATEDHDFAEVDHTWLFDETFRPSRVAVSGSALQNIPVGQVPVCDLSPDAVRTALGELPFAAEVVELIERHYNCSASFGSAFLGLVRELLRPFGFVFLDPLAPEIRAAAEPFLKEVAAQIPELTSDLRARDGELQAAGYHSQVHIDSTTSLLFLLENDRRTPLRFREGLFTAKDRSFKPGDLAAQAERLSPNALLRPVMQDYLLPTVSYVAGPAEIAYFAQSEVLYRRLLGRMPVIYPRNSLTLLDTRSAKLLDRYQMHVTDIFHSDEQVRLAIAAKLVPVDLRGEFTDVRTGLGSSLEGLREKLLAFDPTLAAASSKSLAKINYQLDKITAKTARETMRRDSHAAQDADYLVHSVFPQRHPQERFYSIVPFLAKYGLELPSRLYEEVQLTCPDHMVRDL